MRKLAVALVSGLMLSATGCADNEASNRIDISDSETPAGEQPAERTSSDAASVTSAGSSCTQADVQAKASELSGKIQALASDPAKMQEVASKMQEIQKKVQSDAAVDGYSMQEACDAYDELIGTLG